VQEHDRGRVAAGVLVVEAKAVLGHERHGVTSSTQLRAQG
jgi:hypothetical protein